LNEPIAITPTRMIILGVGWCGMLFFWGFYSGSMPLFLSNFTSSKFAISLVLSLAGLSGCTIPPVVGYLSDRTRTRYGRRRPYIFFGMLTMLDCMLGLPNVTSFGVVALLSAAMYISIDIAQTPYMSLMPDITPPERRSTASGVMNLFGSAGLILCFFLMSTIWDEHPGLAFRLVALISFGSVLASIALLSERRMPKSDHIGTANPLSHLKGILEETNALKFFTAQFFC
jgi:maltose/moltooligosaccharide transporter